MGCSRAATCRTTSTARPSPRPAQAAWRPSRPSGCWPRRATRRSWEHRRNGEAPSLTHVLFLSIWTRSRDPLAAAYPAVRAGGGQAASLHRRARRHAYRGGGQQPAEGSGGAAALCVLHTPDAAPRAPASHDSVAVADRAVISGPGAGPHGLPSRDAASRRRGGTVLRRLCGGTYGRGAATGAEPGGEGGD